MINVVSYKASIPLFECFDGWGLLLDIISVVYIVVGDLLWFGEVSSVESNTRSQ